MSSELSEPAPGLVGLWLLLLPLPVPVLLPLSLSLALPLPLLVPLSLPLCLPWFSRALLEGPERGSRASQKSLHDPS